MGNVYASSPKSPTDAFPTLSPEEPFKSLNEEKLENPGSLDDLHKKCKDLFPINFEGAKIAVQKGLSNHFQVSHSLSMSSVTPSGYRFGATYVGTKQYGPGEAYPVLVGDIDPTGNLNANVFHKFSDNLISKVQAQIQNNRCAAAQYVLDYRGSNYSASLTVANPDITNMSGVLVGHYLQSITKHIDLGAELAYQRNPSIPGCQVAMTSLAARYTGSDFVASTTVGQSGFHVCYYQKASSQLQLGVEFQANLRSQEANASFAYQVDIPKADLVFKGMVDTDWNVGATLDKKLSPMPFNLTLSGMLNHQKNQFRLGLGFVIG